VKQPSDDLRDVIQRVYREHHGWVLARLVRSLRDLDLAEESLQEALLAALHSWPRQGLPDEPRAWLVRAARNKAIDELRRRTMKRAKNDEQAWLAALTSEVDAPDDDLPLVDDMLRLIFTCCHPALAVEARVALTLRVIVGLETTEIARAFLVSDPTMAQRLVRAKNKIRAAGVPYRVPGRDEIRERVAAALAVVYLIFNEGYAASAGDELVRRDLCRIALGLGRELCDLLPDARECMGLMALMLLHDARRASRVGEDGELVLLADQDRSVWDAEQIAEGVALTQRSLSLGAAGPYALQAAIAALHAESPHAEATDWAQIAALYDRLHDGAPTPVIALNRAVAVAMAHGPSAGLSLLGHLEQPLAQYHLFHSARADLLRRLGKPNAARQAYRVALELCRNETERRFLQRRIEEMAGD
jgi:RNA polymerase sigma-70 factor (ECF subfamily)